MACALWNTVCGQCPYLSLPPAIRRDATRSNWKRKRDIFRAARIHVATPSRWLMDKVEQSMLAPAIISKKVIPNGVDLNVFHPGNQWEARAQMNLDRDSKIALFSGYR